MVFKGGLPFLTVLLNIYQVETKIYQLAANQIIQDWTS